MECCDKNMSYLRTFSPSIKQPVLPHTGLFNLGDIYNMEAYWITRRVEKKSVGRQGLSH